ncbi:MAG: glycosyltransferase family 2 protein [Gammaproteobacteria bacterium]
MSLNPANTLTISVIITTYNWPKALALVLQSLFAQTLKPLEILIADDGSSEETRNLIQAIQKTSLIPITHLWQPDYGFRASRARNKALLQAQGHYIIFLDGDVIPRPSFLEHQVHLAKPGYFVSGNRVLLKPEFTQKVLEQNLPIYLWTFFDWFKERYLRLEKITNRIFPLCLFQKPLKTKNQQWQGAKGCNLAFWKEDLWNINGWEEEFSGWGYEDSDLIIRLLRSGIKRCDVKFYIPVVHLWHPEHDRSREIKNKYLLQQVLKTPYIQAKQGLFS